MKILSIETSADDTGIALIDAEGDFEDSVRLKVLANEVASQKVHAEYGGIYPNLAKEEHKKNLPLLLEVAAQKSGMNADKPDIDCLAVTVGPGLEPCLWTGITFAQELAKKWNVPIVPVNHMEGHILVSLLRNERAVSYQLSAVSWPTVVLLISGGHTELILMRAFGEYEYLGRTRDDAVGEAFDKVARMLGLPYPGGPHISKLAEESRIMNQESRIKLPRPMMHEKNFDFSFAGLKTAVLRFVEEHAPLTEDMKKQMAREFEDAAADVLAAKTLRAVEKCGAQSVIVGGGVSANKHIRAELSKQLQAVGCPLLLCPIEFSGDNALMIALAGYFRAQKNEYSDSENLRANGTLKLEKTA